MQTPTRKVHTAKTLSVLLVACLAVSGAAVAASAIEKDELSRHTMGIVGSFTNWGQNGESDVPMNDDDHDGVWEGTVFIESVKADMISEAMTDTGIGGIVSRGFSGVQFKIRLDNAWNDQTNWADFEPAYGRTLNSQTNCCVKAEVGQPLTINVKLDTTKISHDAVWADPDDAIDIDDFDAYLAWDVSYTATSEVDVEPSEVDVEPSEVDVDPGKPTTGNNGTFQYEENEDGTISITGFVSKEAAQAAQGQSLTIPASINGKTVTKVVGSEDYDCRIMCVEVTLPDTIKEIGDNGLAYCSLTTDKLPEGLERIGSHALVHLATPNNKIVMPSTLKYIGERAFAEVRYTEIVLNEGLEYIGSCTFILNGKFPAEITIPKSLKYLGWDAFATYQAAEDMTGIQKFVHFNIYGGGYVEQHMKAYRPEFNEKLKAGYNYTVIGQVDEEPSQTESVNGLSVSGAIPEGAVFQAVATTSKWFPDASFCYEITLNKDNQAVQPDGYITISIPCEYGNGYVVFVDEETGETENLNSIYVNGQYVFVTDHLSTYQIKFDGEPKKSDEQSQTEQSQPEQSKPEQSQSEQSQTEQSKPEQSQPTSQSSTPAPSQDTSKQPIPINNDVPKTGDSAPLAAVVCIVLMAGTLTVLFCKKKTER